MLDHGVLPKGPGELNYLITREIVNYLGLRLGVVPRYSDYNEVVGVLESVKLEMYRRLVSTYEDSKIEENGDVFPLVDRTATLNRLVRGEG